MEEFGEGMSVQLEKRHIKSRKVIGKTEAGDELTLVTTFGGLQIIMKMTDNKPEILGAGAHVAFSKFEAEKACKSKITWNED